MTIAPRIIPILDIDPEGRIEGGFVRGGLEMEHAKPAVLYLTSEGADEIWLRLAQPDQRGAAGLFDTIKMIQSKVFVPLVVGGGIHTASDARLVVGLGAERVVVDCSNLDQGSPVSRIEEIVSAVGSDRVVAELIVRRVAAAESFTWEFCNLDGEGTGQDAFNLLLDICHAGAGEIALIPVFKGQLADHASDLIERLSTVASVQVLSLGLEKEPADLATPLLMGADAVASRQIFNQGQWTVRDVKETLRNFGIPVRPSPETFEQRNPGD
jgi:imidazole glycerol-phosphate synthase subunit HisF